MSLGDQRWTNSGDRFDQAQEAALDILKVVSEQFVNVFVEFHLDSDYEPLGVHLEQQQEGQKRFAS